MHPCHNFSTYYRYYCLLVWLGAILQYCQGNVIPVSLPLQGVWQTQLESHCSGQSKQEEHGAGLQWPTASSALDSGRLISMPYHNLWLRRWLGSTWSASMLGWDNNMSTVEAENTAAPYRSLAVRLQCEASWVYSCSALGDIGLTKRIF